MLDDHLGWIQEPYVQTRHLKAGRETLADQIRSELSNHAGPADLLESVEVAIDVHACSPVRESCPGILAADPLSRQFSSP